MCGMWATRRPGRASASSATCRSASHVQAWRCSSVRQLCPAGSRFHSTHARTPHRAERVRQDHPAERPVWAERAHFWGPPPRRERGSATHAGCGAPAARRLRLPVPGAPLPGGDAGAGADVCLASQRGTQCPGTTRGHRPPRPRRLRPGRCAALRATEVPVRGSAAPSRAGGAAVPVAGGARPRRATGRAGLAGESDSGAAHRRIGAPPMRAGGDARHPAAVAPRIRRRLAHGGRRRDRGCIACGTCVCRIVRACDDMATHCGSPPDCRENCIPRPLGLRPTRRVETRRRLPRARSRRTRVCSNDKTHTSWRGATETRPLSPL